MLSKVPVVVRPLRRHHRLDSLRLADACVGRRRDRGVDTCRAWLFWPVSFRAGPASNGHKLPVLDVDHSDNCLEDTACDQATRPSARGCPPPESPGRSTGVTRKLALATGAAAMASAAAGAFFFAVGEPFGRLNDFGNAVLAVLSGPLAWRLRALFSGPAKVRGLAFGCALVGAVVGVLGSALTITTAGWFLAALVSSAGFALIGVWLIAQHQSMPSIAGQSPLLRTLGVVAGIIMATGFLGIPGIAMGLRDPNTAPAWIWIGFTGWLGIFILYPAWAIWLARALRSTSLESAV
jgi:hypothetical protein